MVSPESVKWKGASKCVAKCVLQLNAPTFIPTPCSRRTERRKPNGTSHGHAAVDGDNGRLISITTGTGLVERCAVIGEPSCSGNQLFQFCDFQILING